MARIAFCWELGRGLGHLVPHVDLIRRLVERGDELCFFAKDPARALAVFRGIPIAIEPLAHGSTPVSDRMRNADSYPEVLYNSGFADVDEVHARVGGIVRELERVAPDVVLCDFAPSVLLANTILRRPIITAGAGFCVPPRETPMPRFRYWLGRAPETAFANELEVLGIINAALERLGVRALARFSDLLAADREWLCTFEELDAYPVRSSARYFGTALPSQFGALPDWPEIDGPRVFAYLASVRTTPAALEALDASGAAVCLYAPTLDPAVKQSLDTDRFRIVEEPVSMRTVAAEAEVFVNNGNLSTAAAALLAGKPQLCLPYAAEQYLNGRRVELAGAGLAAPLMRPGDVAAKLRALLHDPQYARAARRFAAKYAGTNEAERTARMIGDIDELLSGRAT